MPNMTNHKRLDETLLLAISVPSWVKNRVEDNAEWPEIEVVNESMLDN